MEIPLVWEIMGIDHDYIQLGNLSGPVLELKWSPAPSSYSIEKGFSRIRKKRGGHHPWRIQKISLPEAWLRTESVLPVTAETASAFSWQAGEENGRGLLCHVPDADCVMLIRFYDSADAAVQEKYLKKLGFHNPCDTVLWSLFDIEAETPADYPLTAFHFHPGEFNLSFSRKKNRVSLWRWSPASVLAGTPGIEGFARKHFRLPQSFDGFKAVEINGWQGMHWRQCQSAGKRLFPFLDIFPKNNEAGFIWHQTDKNRLLAVHMVSRKESDLEILRSIGRKFQCK